MIEVEFHKLSGEGADVLAGTIRMDEKGITLEPPESIILQKVIAYPLTNPLTQEEMVIEQDPALFLELLQYQYHSPYLRALAPKEDGKEQEEEEEMAPSKDNAPKNPKMAPSLQEFHKGKSLPHAHFKAGWSGLIRDRLGRNQCYQDGAHVACSPDQVQEHMQRMKRPEAGGGGGGSEEHGPQDGGGGGQKFNQFCDQLLDEELHRHRDRVRHARFRERRRWWRGLWKNIRKGVTIAGIGLIIGAGAWAAYKKRQSQMQGEGGGEGEGGTQQGSAGDQPERSEFVLMVRDIDPNARRGVAADFGKVPDERAKDTWLGLKDDKIVAQKVEDAQQLQAAVRHTWKHADWMDAQPGENERVNDFAKRHWPALGKLGDRLDIQDIDNPVVRQHLYEMGQLPENVLEEIAPKAKFYVGAATVTGLNANEDKSGVKPQGWPEGLNATWDDAAGMYDARKRQVAVGIGGQTGSASLAIHQVGHALGNLLGYDNDPALQEHHARLHPRLDPYLKGKGPGNKNGRKELLAESLAVYIKRGEEEAIRQYDKDYVAWLKRTVLKQRPPREVRSTAPLAGPPGNN